MGLCRSRITHAAPDLGGCAACSNLLGGMRTCRFHKALVETDLAISAAASASYPGDKCVIRDLAIAQSFTTAADGLDSAGHLVGSIARGQHSEAQVEDDGQEQSCCEVRVLCACSVGHCAMRFSAKQVWT